MLTESEKIQQLQRILHDSQALKSLLGLIRGIASKYDNFDTEHFCHSQHYKFLLQEMSKIKLPELNNIMDQLREPSAIIALPIKIEPKFTLFFVLVPTGLKFDWHSHPKMTGISKCIHGDIDITTLDYHLLQQAGLNIRAYPKQHLRYERLKHNSPNTISTIEPHALNIHKIEAKSFSAFFDLLMPDYPENTCQFFTAAKETETHLLLEELQSPQEEIKGWDVYLNELVQSEKHLVKTFILQ